MACFCYIILLTTISLSFGQLQDCLFEDRDSSMILDLRSLNELVFTFQDDTYNYSYSVCSNNFYCKPKLEPAQYVMVNQYNNEECWWLAQWNDTNIKQPFYYQNEWNFVYYLGMACDGSPTGRRETNIRFRCNESVQTAQIIAVNEFSTCQYDVIIQSKYACNSTLPPDCNWYANGGDVLDLTSYNNTVISSFDTEDTSLVFVYTPCRNDVKCAEMDVMAKLENIASSLCVSYLSVWDDDYFNNTSPYYDETNKVWEFEYKNGQECDGLPSAFYVYWFCNPTIIAPDVNVKKAENVGPCLYELEIESNVAC